MVSDVWVMASLWQLLSLPQWFVAFVAIASLSLSVCLYVCVCVCWSVLLCCCKTQTDEKENWKNERKKKKYFWKKKEWEGKIRQLWNKETYVDHLGTLERQKRVKIRINNDDRNSETLLKNVLQKLLDFEQIWWRSKNSIFYPNVFHLTLTLSVPW